MERFKAKSIDLKQMSNVRGGGTEITLDNLIIKITKLKKEVIAEGDTKIEVSGTVEVEQ